MKPSRKTCLPEYENSFHWKRKVSPHVGMNVSVTPGGFPVFLFS